MSDPRSPKDRLLELVVFGPAGLAVTMVEEFPKLVEKGRQRVQGQLNTARLLGSFAVQMGRRQLEQATARLSGDTDGARPEPTAPGGGQPRRTPATAHAPTDDEAPRGAGGKAQGISRAAPEGHDAASLAIPGYDSLSASQVVQRLEGLSGPELEEVRAHEVAHRQRRTILHRVEQLLAGPTGAT